MNKQFNTSDTYEGTRDDTNIPLENSDRLGDHAPFLAGAPIVVNETTVEQLVHEPLMETPLRYPITEHNQLPYETTLSAHEALLDSAVSQELHTRWNTVQAGFVDEPRTSVQQADALVSEVIEKLAQMFADEHGTLEAQWKEGKDVSTEDLRQALQHYRAFFNRLVV